MPDEYQDPGQTNAQLRIVLEHRIRQRRQPAWPLGKILVQPLACHEQGEAAYGVLPGLRAQRVVDRLAGQALLLEPCARAAVQQRTARRRYRALQALAQKVLKQVMVAIPMPAGIQADEKEVRL